MVEKKIYSPWAFTENEKEKSHINNEIYKELVSKYKILYLNRLDLFNNRPNATDSENYDIIYSSESKYHRNEYKIYQCPEELTAIELALICDGGNLCFGFGGDKTHITIYTD